MNLIERKVKLADLKNTFWIFVVFFCNSKLAYSQQCQSPFVSSNLTCQPYLSGDSPLVKTYETTITVIRLTSEEFNREVFTAALSTVYNNALQGFNGFRTSTYESTSDTNIKVGYVATYDFAVLKSTSSSEEVSRTIANLTYIDQQLKNDATFSSLYVVNQNESLLMKESRTCNQVSCANPSYMKCSESSLDVCCQSVCCASNYCQHQGHCFHGASNVQPKCSCVVHTNYWYVGDRCQAYLHLWMPIVACVMFVILLVFIIAFSIYKILQLNKKTPMQILEELKERKDKKLTSYLKKETKSMFASDSLKAALCCFGERKDRSDTSSPRKQNEEQAAAVAATGGEQQAPTPLPRTNFNYAPPPTADGDQQLSEVAESTNDDDDMHETTSRSSFDDEEVEDDAHLYDDVPENGEADDDDDDDGVRSFDTEDDANFYSVPPYNGAATDSSQALGNTTRAMSVSTSDDDDRDAIYPEPLITTV